MDQRVVAPVALALALAVGPAAPARGGGFSNLDIGTQRSAMMAVVAAGDDATMIYHNPANLVEIEGDQFMLSENTVIIKTEIRLRYPDDSLTGNIEPTRYYGLVPFAGYVGRFGSEDFAGGLALYFPNLYGAAMPEDSPTRYLVSEATFVTGYLTPAAAYRVTDWLSVGAGLDLIYVSLTLDRAFNTRQLFEDPEDFDPRNYDPDYDLWMRIDGQDEVLSWHAGVTVTPFTGLRLAAVYYARAELEVEGDLAVDISERIETEYHLEDFTTDSRVSMLVPASVRLGASYEFMKRWQVGLDYNWWKYSDYRKQTVQTGLAEEFEQYGFTFDYDFSSVKNYTNSRNVSFGIACQATGRLRLMLGCQRDWTPAPERTYSLDNPNLSLWGLALGAKYRLTPKYQAELSFGHYNYDRINNRGSDTYPPTNGIGDGRWYGVGVALLYRP